MQNFRTLAAFFLLEKQQPQKERRRKKMPSTMATSAFQGYEVNFTELTCQISSFSIALNFDFSVLYALHK